MIHIATGMAKIHDVTVLQSSRKGGDLVVDGGVTWASTQDAAGSVAAADVVILQRKSQPLVRLARWNRRARYIVWMHDWQPVEDRSVRGGRWKRGLKAEARSIIARTLGVQWIGVSRAHVGNIRAFLAADRLIGSAGRLRVSDSSTTPSSSARPGRRRLRPQPPGLLQCGLERP
ncbi:hypothetical protein P0F65_12365 [Sphingomonas sp. I4]